MGGVIKRRKLLLQINGKSNGGANFRHSWIQEFTWWHQDPPGIYTMTSGPPVFPFCFLWNLLHFQAGPLHVAIKMAHSSSSLTSTLFWQLEKSEKGACPSLPLHDTSPWKWSVFPRVGHIPLQGKDGQSSMTNNLIGNKILHFFNEKNCISTRK